MVFTPLPRSPLGMHHKASRVVSTTTFRGYTLATQHPDGPAGALFAGVNLPRA